ncbi:hypothetical protein SAMN06265222_1011123 [Neorhodopirellula lusitana]|uniref:Uncharacterized protein n=1 Tax=Neorhodopirellula lusitana TaxID=445327 RepID=A0ABY1PSM0_9BACT|nr:hypothetical protein SAMN06265222_1011123 [Neorhodopirellula lusitana]
MPEQGTLAGKTEDEITVAVGKKQWRFAFPASYSVRQAIGTDHCLGGIDARCEMRGWGMSCRRRANGFGPAGVSPQMKTESPGQSEPDQSQLVASYSVRGC